MKIDVPNRIPVNVEVTEKDLIQFIRDKVYATDNRIAVESIDFIPTRSSDSKIRVEIKAYLTDGDVKKQLPEPSEETIAEAPAEKVVEKEELPEPPFEPKAEAPARTVASVFENKDKVEFVHVSDNSDKKPNLSPKELFGGND